jgi:hypothetical protein
MEKDIKSQTDKPFNTTAILHIKKIAKVKEILKRNSTLRAEGSDGAQSGESTTADLSSVKKHAGKERMRRCSKRVMALLDSRALSVKPARTMQRKNSILSTSILLKRGDTCCGLNLIAEATNGLLSKNLQ